MKINRRGFAKILGLAPLAAKAAADAEMAKVSGITLSGASPGLYVPSNAPQPLNFEDYNSRRNTAAKYAQAMGLPDFVKETFRRNSVYVSVLDPDIAAKRSWSMSVKIVTQRERNYNRQIETLSYNLWYNERTSFFKALTGWDWPW